MIARLIYGVDVIEGLRKLSDDSVHCIVTSPPYWGLRSYGVEGQLGLEKTPEEFVAKMVEVFQEIKRVLRKDGTLWLNLGDSYAAGGWGGGIKKKNSNRGLKPKDLCGIPWRVAFALQAEGWWLRSDIIWSKPNPMPESVTDRPTKAHEYLFLLTKTKNYFYDAEAVKEPNSDGAIKRFGKNGNISVENRKHESDASFSTNRASKAKEFSQWLDNGRNKRSVWTIPTEPYPEAHFATFPMELVKPCILAGTSAEGCCEKCGKPYKRLLESKQTGDQRWSKKGGTHRAEADGSRINSESSVFKTGSWNINRTVGWVKNCKCNAGKIPCVVLDPFSGSGTTGEVATGLGRRFIGIDLNKKYEKLARNRLGLFVNLHV